MVAQYDPPRHAAHDVDPIDPIYVPARQLEQTEDDSIENEPAVQTPVTAVKPVVAQYDPPGQAVHALDPVEACKVPAGHAVQLLEPAPE